MDYEQSAPAPLSVLIIGAGFGGIGLAIELDRAGISDYLILEKAGEVGGTWRDNSYPGAACDVPSHLYSFSFEPKADWSSRYAPQEEILAYIRHCVHKYDLSSRIRLSREVSEAQFDESSGLWRVLTTRGERFVTRALISACGQLNRPVYPKIPGLENFAGAVFHSAHWRHDLPLYDQRIAVIGTGASAIQFVPKVAAQASRLILFQRSAPYVIGKADKRYSQQEHATLRRFPLLQKFTRAAQYLAHESRALAFISYPSLMKSTEEAFAKHLEAGVRDPVKRAKLEPDYPIGCKRILISNDFYPALDRPNVDIVTEAIQCVTADAVVTADGAQHSVDTIILGTGFAATDFLAPMKIVGQSGADLNQAWRSGAEAYKGISVHGFPNLFILYGPNTNLGHNSIIYMLESQFRYVIACLQEMRRCGVRYMDVKADAQASFNTDIQKTMSTTVWSRGCSSWYQTAEGKQTNNWPGYTFHYRRLTRRPDKTHYVWAY